MNVHVVKLFFSLKQQQLGVHLCELTKKKIDDTVTHY